MRKLVTLLSMFSIVISFSCQEEDFANEPLRQFSLAGIPKQSGVDLQIYVKDYYPGALSWTPAPVNKPESYDVFISPDPGAEFKRATTVFTEGYRLSLENLIDGTPYFITATANKKGQLSVQSDTIMVMPSKLKQISKGRYDYAHKVSLSPTADSAAYIAWQIYGETPDLFIFPYFTNYPRRIESNVTECKWSPSGELIAFAKRVDVSDASGKELQLSVYDISSDSIINLPVLSTSLGSIVFSPDSEWIYYVDGDVNDTDLVWRIKADGTSREAVFGRQSPGLENAANFVVGKITVHKNGEDIYFSGGQERSSLIYRYNLTTGIAEIVFNDRWSSSSPSLSPDGQKLAFFSTRSGAQEIWIYDFPEGSFQQLTGFQQVSWYGLEIAWVTNSEMAVGNFRVHL